MHLFVSNMADPDISDYQFDADADDLFRRLLYCIWKFHGINWRFDGRKSSLLSILMVKCYLNWSVHEAITADLYILNWKSSYDVTLFMRQSRSTLFPGILMLVIFRPRDMRLKECYIPTPNALACKQYGWPRYFRLSIWRWRWRPI
jgi:hypothetical protein